MDDPATYYAAHAIYLPPEARFEFLLTLPESANVGAKVIRATDHLEGFRFRQSLDRK